LLDEANARIQQSATFAWAVPGLAIAAESFLLASALSTNATPKHQVIACSAGIVILIAALHFLLKHAFNFRVCEAVMERSRQELGLPFVSMGQLVGSATPDNESEEEQVRIKAIRESFPAHVELVRRGWLDPQARRWRRLRNYAARRVRAEWVWSIAILTLIVLDGRDTRPSAVSALASGRRVDSHLAAYRALIHDANLADCLLTGAVAHTPTVRFPTIHFTA
jgi:hypothetical protein